MKLRNTFSIFKMTLSSAAATAAKQASRSPWMRSTILNEAIPKLRERLSQHATMSDEENEFPLMSKKVQNEMWQTCSMETKRKAAVLVPLVSYEGVPSLLFTTRSSNLSTHASEVSFPGGHFDEGVDDSLEATAVREAQEELLGDYPWHDIEIIGSATAVPSIKGTPVTPIIACLPHEISSDSFPGHPGEVDEVFCVALSDLLEIETSEPSARFRTPIPVYLTKEGRKIWGLTAVVVRPLLHKLFKPVFFGDNGNT
jgi:nudix motif 8